MYNSISMDMVVGPVAKVEKIEDQMEQFVDYARNFGVPQVSEYIIILLNLNVVIQLAGISIRSF